MEPVASCPACGYTFVDVAEVRCPRCGRVLPLSINVADEIRVSANERLIAEGRGGGSEGVGVADSRWPQSSAADWPAQGTPTYSIAGENRHEEQGSVDVASRLVVRLNQDGAHWGDVVDPKVPGLDYVASDAVDPARKLRVQVTRAVGGQLRRELANHGRVTRQVASPDDAADELRASIEVKITKLRRQLACEEMREITLALDAEETLAHLFEAVRESFRRRHGGWAAACGFAAIWLVGATVERTCCLAS